MYRDKDMQDQRGPPSMSNRMRFRKEFDETAWRAGEAADIFCQWTDKTIPFQYYRTFLRVAQMPGLSVTEYAQQAGVSKSVMSRHLLDIGARNRHMQEGFGLVQAERAPNELRRAIITLTPKGAALWRKMEPFYSRKKG